LGGGWCMVIIWICRGVCAWKHPSLQAPTRRVGSLMWVERMKEYTSGAHYSS
jgi:hypothetical protein